MSERNRIYSGFVSAFQRYSTKQLQLSNDTELIQAERDNKDRQ